MRIATAIRSLVLAAVVSAIPAASFAGIFVSVGIGAPPVLPVYVQPVCPAPGYIWTPGYWAYDEQAGYYWVPGAWVLAPYTGALWTPGYWGWGNGGYLWNAGYWGLHVGFYGGVNYGFGYFGRGFEGGRWDHGVFAYNRAIMHVDGPRFHNVYNERIVNNYNTTRVSFNGGHGGINERPNADEQRWSHEQHMAPMAAQHQNEMRASQNRAQFANVNHGRPENLARTEPASFNRNMPANTRPAVNNARPMTNNQNFNRPAVNNASRPPTQTYRPQATSQASRPQQNYSQPRSQPQAARPQESHPQPAHSSGGGGGHEGGHEGGHGR
jgi:WXXGXW repeat (2 copies)